MLLWMTHVLSTVCCRGGSVGLNPSLMDQHMEHVKSAPAGLNGQADASLLDQAMQQPVSPTHHGIVSPFERLSTVAVS